MLFQLFAVSALCAVSSATRSHSYHKRTSASDIDLFAYGGPIGGASIWYADGLAYFGLSDAMIEATVATNISFTMDKDSTTTPWTISPNTTTNPNVSFNETLEMYIVPTNDTFTQVGFASANSSSLPTGAVQTGFAFFGTNVAYAESDSNYEMMFWGNATTTDGVYALYWNAESSSAPDTSFAVTVKVTPPVSLS